MTMNSSLGPAPRVLVLGGGIPAQVVTQALAAMGAEVTFARVLDTPAHVYCTQPGTSREDIAASLPPGKAPVTTIDVDKPPAVDRSQEGFVARMADGTTSVHDCLVLAPGITLRSKPANLAESTELFSSDTVLATGERIAFLLDYVEPSDPSLGMKAMQLAIQNVQQGGASVVCFRHAPVRHLFGETLYDNARKAGVQFIRFGKEPPAIQQPEDQNRSSLRFVAHDVIDREDAFHFECDRVCVVTGPDPASLPHWARDIAAKDLDGQGFALSDSVHCNSGNAFASGVFMVGNGTGNLDLIGSIAQAKSAAVKALAWTRTSRLKKENESIEVGSGCVRCLTCHRVCPHEAIPPLVDPIRARMTPVPALCRDCGICASVCPGVAIRLPVCPEESMTRFVSDLPHDEIRSTLFVFGCQRSAGIIAQAMDMPENVRFFAVQCAGSVSENVIWSGLAAGARGILVVGCHHGNCASHTGTDWAAARVRSTLETGLFANEAPRVGYATIAANEPGRFQRLVSAFLAELPVV